MKKENGHGHITDEEDEVNGGGFIVSVLGS